MSDVQSLLSRRNALKCMAYGGAGTLFVLSGGVFAPIDLAMAASDKYGTEKLGKPLFVQISDTHIGFNKEANPDVAGTLTQTIDIVNRMRDQPALIIHTGDITHLSKPAEFDLAQQLFSRLRTTEMHTVPGEHDTTDATVTEYFNRFGKASDNKGYYSFDHAGVQRERRGRSGLSGRIALAGGETDSCGGHYERAQHGREPLHILSYPSHGRSGHCGYSPPPVSM